MLQKNFSESSCRGPGQQQAERKISGAFVDAKPPNPEDFFMPDIPFFNLITSTTETPQDKKTEKCDEAATQPSNKTQEKMVQVRIFHFALVFVNPVSGVSFGS